MNMLYKEPYAKIFSEITAKCWKDAEFKQRFLSDPESIVRDYGVEVPEGIDIKVVEDASPDTVTLHLPPAPSSELSDQDLEAVSGGKRTCFVDPFTGQKIGDC